MNQILFQRSGRLFANPAFADGFSLVFDICGSHYRYNIDTTPQEVDSKALYSDWASVGDHLVLAAKELVQEQKIAR
jgi:hypothetical protein